MSTTRWFPDDMPVPAASRETLGWWQAAAEHRLVVQRCEDCGHMRHPPGPICPACRSSRHGWHELSGRGTIYTYTIVHRAYLPSLADRVPYAVVAVELEGGGGTRLISNLVEADPATVHVGMAVELAWEDMGPELALPRFRPARAK
jgi:uncharacterized OB-fold protein